MLKKTVSYTDFLGVERTKDLRFNLTKTELSRLELSAKDGMDVYIQRLVDAEDNAALMAVWEDILVSAYGEIQEDGEIFMKSPELWNRFKHSAAYDALFIELTQDTDAAIAFVNALMPSDLIAAVQENQPKKVLAA